jgi:hypothetical protein
VRGAGVSSVWGAERLADGETAPSQVVGVPQVRFRQPSKPVRGCCSMLRRATIVIGGRQHGRTAARGSFLPVTTVLGYLTRALFPLEAPSVGRTCKMAVPGLFLL